MKLYQYAILYIPKEKEDEKSEAPHIIKQIQSIIAKDENQAMILAAREIPEDYLTRLDEVQLVVRPF